MRDQGQRPEVRHIDVSGAVDGRHAVARHVRTDVSNAGESRELLLVGRTHVGLGGLRAVAEGSGESGLHQSLSERALGAVGGSSDDTGREAAIRTTRTPVIVRGDEGEDTGSLPGRGAGFSNRSVVADDALFEVGPQFDGLEDLLASQFRSTASLVHDFLRARNAAGLGEDLHVVADAGRQVASGEGVVITFELGIGRGGRGEGLGLPFMVGRGGLLRADVGHERGLLGSDAEDGVFQVLTNADVRGSAGDGIGGSGHSL